MNAVEQILNHQLPLDNKYPTDAKTTIPFGDTQLQLLFKLDPSKPEAQDTEKLILDCKWTWSSDPLNPEDHEFLNKFTSVTLGTLLGDVKSIQSSALITEKATPFQTEFISALPTLDFEHVEPPTYKQKKQHKKQKNNEEE